MLIIFEKRERFRLQNHGFMPNTKYKKQAIKPDTLWLTEIFFTC